MSGIRRAILAELTATGKKYTDKELQNAFSPAGFNEEKGLAENISGTAKEENDQYTGKNAKTV